MKKIFISLLMALAFFILTACTDNTHVPYPKNPNYGIKKPSIIYKPSKDNLARMVKELQGSPYVWAEEGPNQFDCSGLTYYMYGSMGIELPRVAREQAKRGQRVSLDNLQYGDLIFFATSRKSRKKITHVGMYLGNGWFTHASTKTHEVIYTNLFKTPYYKNRVRVCRRYLKNSKPIKGIKKVKTWKPVPVQKSVKKPSIYKAVVIKTPKEYLKDPSSKDSFYIQVGSSSEYPTKSSLDTIKQYNYQHKIIQLSANGENIYRVFIGPYKTRANASSHLSHIQRSIKEDAFIARIQ